MEKPGNLIPVSRRRTLYEAGHEVLRPPEPLPLFGVQQIIKDIFSESPKTVSLRKCETVDLEMWFDHKTPTPESREQRVQREDSDRTYGTLNRHLPQKSSVQNATERLIKYGLSVPRLLTFSYLPSYRKMITCEIR